MEDRFSQQLKKGVLELLVMELLCDKPSYGYEILVQLREKSDGRFVLKEGTLYPHFVPAGRRRSDRSKMEPGRRQEYAEKDL